MAEHTFGDLIRERRSQLGLTQARVAELVGRSPSTVRSWERGRSVPGDHETLAAVAAVLGISDAELDPLFDDMAGGRLAVAPPPPPAGPVAAPPVEAAPRAATPKEAAAAAELALPDMAPPSQPAEAVARPEAGVPEPEDAAPVSTELGGDELVEAEAPTSAAAEQAPAEMEPPVLELVQEEPSPVETPAAAPTAVEEVPAEDGERPAAEAGPGPAEPPPPTPLAPGTRGAAPTAARAGVALRGDTPWGEPPRAAAPRSYFQDPVAQTTYRIRLALTLAVGVLLLIVLLWALGELGEALSGVLQQLRREG